MQRMQRFLFSTSFPPTSSSGHVSFSKRKRLREGPRRIVKSASAPPPPCRFRLRLVKRAAVQRTALLADVLEELVPVLPGEPAGRPRGRVAQGADGVPLDLIRHGEDGLEVLLLAASFLDLPEQALEPAAAFAARRALAARFVR